jgi:hypothetical protein
LLYYIEELVKDLQRLVGLKPTAFEPITFSWDTTAASNQTLVSGRLPKGTVLPLQNVSASTVEVPTLQFGGIVSGPTLAMLGENGPEAVVPLGRDAGAGGTIVLKLDSFETRNLLMGGEIIKEIRRSII